MAVHTVSNRNNKQSQPKSLQLQAFNHNHTTTWDLAETHELTKEPTHDDDEVATSSVWTDTPLHEPTKEPTQDEDKVATSTVWTETPLRSLSWLVPLAANYLPATKYD